MSGPPGTGILNRGPYNGTSNITGAPKRGIDGGLPSGKVQAGFRNDVIEPMANATATFPFFIAPVRYENTILENDILMVQSDDGRKDTMSNVSSQYGIIARPLRLLSQTPDIFMQANGAGEQEYDGDDALANAKAAAMRWKCLGIVVAVGARSDRDRQVVNVAIRGRLGVPNIFKNTKEVRAFPAANGNRDARTTRGDLFAVTISVVEKTDSAGVYVLRVGTAAIQSVGDVPRNDDGTVITYYHILGTYIRQLSNANAGTRTIADYLSGGNTILDRKATFEIALRL